MRLVNKEIVEMTPDVALDLLIHGNERFTNGMTVNRDFLEQVKATSDGQKPFAAILGCMDSRVPAEILFDQGIGDLFNVRMAGNIVSENILGSLEYAVAAVGSKVIVVLGHTACGAIKGACDDVKLGNLTHLLTHIKPAIEREKTVTEDRTSNNIEFVDKVAVQNVYHSIEEMLERSAVIRELLEAGKIKVVPAMYNVGSGKVTFLPLEQQA